MLKLPKSSGYVLLEAMIGLMILTVIVSLLSFMVGQLYHRQQLKTKGYINDSQVEAYNKAPQALKDEK